MKVKIYSPNCKRQTVPTSKRFEALIDKLHSIGVRNGLKTDEQLDKFVGLFCSIHSVRLNRILTK